MRTPDEIVRTEILCCMSGLVATLASGITSPRTSLEALCEQAFELAAPIDDWREAASQHGLTLEMRADGLHVLNLPEPDEHGHLSDMHVTAYENSEQAAIAYCDHHGLDPYQREVFEHWAVTDWMADKLIEQGEKVDKDFAGLCVWARTTTGQAIAADGVIARVCEAAERDYQAVVVGLSANRS